MADVLNNAAIDRLARWILGLAGAAPALELRLFQTPVVVTNQTVESQLSEVTAPGYAPVGLVAANWSGSTTGGIAVYNYPVIQITFTGQGVPAQTVYGHWIRDTLTAQLLWAQTWVTPYAIPPGGGSVFLTPTWQDQQC
ncbi:MAG: hypothetical protein ACYC6M_09085 [Terriglobales bacterium]